MHSGQSIPTGHPPSLVLQVSMQNGSIVRLMSHNAVYAYMFAA